ncbi:hypothetical protein SCMU_21130 [Sinomonas cyclohexanicum]|uniref:Uncharacterized protein n=1 Tax=Sinomonas cyclohexanicum TaxID=322009 RepID=A0ABN6FHY3_SINCY|nr:hypothetical protein [Corynebacterium cyclohexanicum]BCT76271.1 hypothetical protein SCMU_21130 [Corynebacterium cyclohexanicum]
MNGSALGIALTLFSGVAWTVAYIEAIRLGVRQRTYAMPVAALGLNLAWEWLYAGVGFAEGGSLQTVVNVAWGLADLAILATFLRFGYREFSDRLGRTAFYVGAAVLILACVLVQVLFLAEFGPQLAPGYSAFLQNLLMSGLFIAMHLARGGNRGQSVLLAAAKWLGTLAPTLQFGLLSPSSFILGIGLLCSVFDLAYLGLVVRARRTASVRPEKVSA